MAPTLSLEQRCSDGPSAINFANTEFTNLLTICRYCGPHTNGIDEVFRYRTLTTDRLARYRFQHPSDALGWSVIIIVWINREQLRDNILLSWYRSPDIGESTAAILVIVRRWSRDLKKELLPRAYLWRT